MANVVLDRRDFLMTMMALGVAGFARGGASYDPAAAYEVAVSEVEFRKNSAGRMLMARVYQPKGRFPRSSTCMAARGTRRTAPPKSRWIARSRPAACWWSRST